MASAYPDLGAPTKDSSLTNNDSLSNNSSPNTSSLQNKMQNARDAVVNNASSAYNSIANHPTTQNLANGPAAEKARLEANKTSQEFSNVLDAKKVPEQKAATGQSLTQYHSLFYNILTWENPRVTTIAFASTITFIFFTRYVPILKYTFKALYVVLGITAAAEVVGKLVFDKGFSSHMRPRKYYTIPRESLESSLEDIEQLINFFVIEFQRIVFAENVYATVAAFSAALIGYFLVKFVPTWGIALIATSFIYLVPLVYIKNRRVIDEQLTNAGNIINEQATQVRDLAAHHTGRAVEVTKSTANEYTTKAQELMGQAKNRAASPSAPNPANLNPQKNEPEREIKTEDFPSAPSSAPSGSANTPFGSTNTPSFGSTNTPSYGSVSAGTPHAPSDIVRDNVAYGENNGPEQIRADGIDHIKAQTFAQ